MKTPRTDEMERRHAAPCWLSEDKIVSAEFARKLETEIIELKKNLVSAVESVLEIRDLLDPNGTLSVFDAVDKIREEMQSVKTNLIK